MTGFVAKDLHAPFGRAALDFEHLRLLEPHQPRVCQIEGNGDARHAVGREPLGRDPGMRAELQAPAGKFAIEVGHALFEPAAFDAKSEVREPELEQGLVRQIREVDAGGGCGLSATEGSAGEVMGEHGADFL